MNDSIEDTVDSLRDELDQMAGNQKAIERRRYERQKADLLEQQQQGGDVGEALGLLERVYRERVRKIDQEERRGQDKTPVREEKITLTGPGGDTVTGRFDEGDTERFVRSLQQTGLRVTA